MKNAIMVTDLKTKLTFILEVWRPGSKTIHASAMPAVGPFADKRVALGRVPLYIRTAAKVALLKKEN